jgi:hypothetical protein
VAFNADEYHATVSPPWEFTTGGRTYVAQHVSTPAVERYLQVLEDHPTETRKGQARRSAALLRLLRLAFPWRLSYWWNRRADPVWQFLHLPPRTRKEALEDFFGRLGIVELTTPQTTTASTGSTPSGDPTSPIGGSGSSGT